MKVSILVLLAMAISLNACVHRAESDNMLDHRAGYEMDVSSAEKLLPDSSRRNLKSAVAWIYPSKLPSGDYLWGAWMSLKIEEPGWNLYVPRYEQDGTFLEKELPNGSTLK